MIFSIFRENIGIDCSMLIIEGSRMDKENKNHPFISSS
jgi:hypothetical protein